MGTVKIIITEDGNFEVEAVAGFEGKACQEAINKILDSLPSNFQFETIETVRHGNYNVAQKEAKQAYTQELGD